MSIVAFGHCGASVLAACGAFAMTLPSGSQLDETSEARLRELSDRGPWSAQSSGSSFVRPLRHAAYGAPFRHLTSLSHGDTISIWTGEGHRTYVVDRVHTAKAGDVQDALVGRLGAQPVQLPPLRERLEDLGRLVEFFLRDMRAAETSLRTFETEAFHALFLYGWPLNVRELQKTVVEAEVLSRGQSIIGFSHLPDVLAALLEPSADAGHSSVVSATRDFPKDGAGGGEGEGSGVPDAADEATTARTRRPAPTAEELTTLLRQYRGSVAHVARHLDRQYAVVWRCLQRYGINADDFRSPGGGNS